MKKTIVCVGIQCVRRHRKSILIRGWMFLLDSQACQSFSNRYREFESLPLVRGINAWRYLRKVVLENARTCEIEQSPAV
jgi:hypothetical protein